MNAKNESSVPERTADLRQHVEQLVGKERLEAEEVLAEMRRLEEKHALEMRKVEAEIEELHTPIWKKASFYSATMPIALAIAGVVFSWSSGWFDAQQKKLDAQRISLEYDIKKLEARKVQIEADLITMRSEGEALKVENSKLLEEKQGLLSATTNLIRELDVVRKDIGTKDLEITETRRKLAASEGDRSYLLDQLKRLQKEKNELVEQFNDLERIRDQVRQLRDELSISSRLDWIRRGLYGSLSNSNRLLNAAVSTQRFDLNVELRQDGTARVLTNSPDTARTK